MRRILDELGGAFIYFGVVVLLMPFFNNILDAVSI
mgnify:CR=1 FL=1